MTKFSTMIGLITVAAVGVTPVLGQTVPDTEVPTTSLNIPGNVKLYGDDKPNVYRPSATVNGERRHDRRRDLPNRPDARCCRARLCHRH